MIVLDASAVFELVLATASGRVIALRISDPEESLHCPHLLDVEVVQALRRSVRLRDIDSETAAEAIDAMRELGAKRHVHEPLLRRVWALRENLSAYDATYVALAESLDATLLTCDPKLARSLPRGSRVDVELVR